MLDIQSLWFGIGQACMRDNLLWRQPSLHMHVLCILACIRARTMTTSEVQTTAAEDHRYNEASELWRIATVHGILLQRLLLRCVCWMFACSFSEHMSSCKQT